MPGNLTVDEVIADGERIVRVWRDNPTFTLGEISLPQPEAKMASLRALRGQIENTRTQLTQLVNDSNANLADINNVATRARSGFRAFFGLVLKPVRAGRRHTHQRAQTSRSQTPA